MCLQGPGVAPAARLLRSPAYHRQSAVTKARALTAECIQSAALRGADSRAAAVSECCRSRPATRENHLMDGGPHGEAGRKEKGGGKGEGGGGGRTRAARVRAFGALSAVVRSGPRPRQRELLYEGLSFQRGLNMLEVCDCGGPLGSRGPTPQSPWTPVEL
ncbi:unnamed protein product [Gadus morhua 'NCC']